jgi:hypothetical protein
VRARVNLPVAFVPGATGGTSMNESAVRTPSRLCARVNFLVAFVPVATASTSMNRFAVHMYYTYEGVRTYEWVRMYE